MATFRVWAPRADGVELKLAEETLPMAVQNGDWWSVEAPQAQAGMDYAYVLDGGEPLPDPRSPWQPHGVHGPSRLVNHGDFTWTDDNWQAPPLRDAIIYELHVGTFTPAGTFDAASERLDYLKALGITHIQLMPVAQFPGKWGWGYDGVSLYAPQNSYGGPTALKRLVNACHQQGIAVLLDVVYNHLGPDGNYLAQYGPYFTDRYQTPWGDAVNFDGPGSYEVRRFFIDNALMWLRDYHFDGLRLDAVQAIIDQSAVHFLEQLSQEVEVLERELGRRLVLIAESDLNDPRVVRPVAAGGYGIDAQWSDDFHHALHTALTGEQEGYYIDFGTLADLATALRQAFVYANRYSVFRDRCHGALPTTLADGRHLRLLPGNRFLGYLQNHDQIGNRAQGERISHLVEPELVKVGAALMLTAPFVPMLFQGEEWGASNPFLYFTDHQDHDLAEAVREGRQEEFASFGWSPDEVADPQAEETFERSKLEWDEVAQPVHESLITWYRQLLRLRRKQPALRDTRLESVQVEFDEDERWLVLYRGLLTVVCNFADISQTVPVNGAAYEILLASGSGSELDVTGRELTLSGPGVVILKSGTTLK